MSKSQTPDQARLAAARFLLIDDEPYVRDMTREMLHHLGAEQIFRAGDGGEGFRETIRIKPDLVFCDVNMKPVNGLEYVAKVRGSKLVSVSETPIVLLTADAHEETVYIAKRLKVDGYLVKPVSAAGLIKYIEHVLKISVRHF